MAGMRGDDPQRRTRKQERKRAKKAERTLQRAIDAGVLRGRRGITWDVNISAVLPPLFFKELPEEPLENWQQDLLEQTGLISCDTLSLPEADSPSATDAYPALGYLWVYEPQDLEEMSLDEVARIWEHRKQLCGSREAAAEVLALIEIMTGQVDTYQGWQAYLEHPVIQEFTPTVEPVEALPVAPLPPVDDTPAAPSPPEPEPEERELDFPALSRLDLEELDIDEIKDAWERRPESFTSLEAASEALGQLRHAAGIPGDHRWQTLMVHAEILKLADELPDRDDEVDDPPATPEATSIPAPGPSQEALQRDQRQRRQQEIVVREGQQGFRQSVLDNFRGTCCVSGCREPAVLEAAHITPYRGPHSHHPANGLCLRVDLHRLFDSFKLSIDPETLRVVTAPHLAHDPSYRDLAGHRLSPGTVPASRDLLAEHFARFQERLAGTP